MEIDLDLVILLLYFALDIKDPLSVRVVSFRQKFIIEEDLCVGVQSFKD